MILNTIDLWIASAALVGLLMLIFAVFAAAGCVATAIDRLASRTVRETPSRATHDDPDVAGGWLSGEFLEFRKRHGHEAADEWLKLAALSVRVGDALRRPPGPGSWTVHAGGHYPPEAG